MTRMIEKRLVRLLDASEEEIRAEQELLQAHIQEGMASLAPDLDEAALAPSSKGFDAGRFAEYDETMARLLQVARPVTLKLDLAPGLQVLAPPYDVGWAVGSGSPLSHWDGQSVIFAGDGFSASGFGVRLRADRPLSVSVVPQGRYEASVGSFVYPSAPPLRATGGTGTVVYLNGASVLSRQARVFDISDAAAPLRHIDLPFAETASPPPPSPSFGSVPLAPVMFNMDAGDRALVWFWIWTSNSGTEGDGKYFMCIASADIPLVTVASSDPLVLR